MVTFSHRALVRMGEIFDWNCQHYRKVWSISYVNWLISVIENIEQTSARLHAVESAPHLSYAVFKKSSKKVSHGYVAIFEHTDDGLVVLDIFHTAQDWRAIVGT